LFTETLGLPKTLQFINYYNAWELSGIGIYFKNSISIVTLSVIMLLIVSIPAAYAISRIKFRGSEMLLNFFIFGLGVPAPLLIIPLYGLLMDLKILNTHFGLIIVYVSLSIPFSIYILYGFFKSLPVELEESASIDGASPFKVFLKIILPLSTNGIAIVTIFNFIGLWNEYLLALVFLRSDENYTISLGLYGLFHSLQHSPKSWAPLVAAIIIVIVPLIIVFLLISKKIIEGLTIGAIKG
jgi:raffinose/stachyose/melibiose transport system permease protein/N-acetylglucosamine transport system permease protein